MPYTKDNVLKKTTPYHCLKTVYKKPGKAYPTAIAAEIDVQQPTISDILTAFEDLNVVNKGRRTKAQYYKVDRNGLWNYQKQVINNDIFAVSKDEFNKFVELYLKKVHMSTVNQMMQDWSKVVLAKSDIKSNHGTLWILDKILDSHKNKGM